MDDVAIDTVAKCLCSNDTRRGIVHLPVVGDCTLTWAGDCTLTCGGGLYTYLWRGIVHLPVAGDCTLTCGGGLYTYLWRGIVHLPVAGDCTLTCGGGVYTYLWRGRNVDGCGGHFVLHGTATL